MYRSVRIVLAIGLTPIAILLTLYRPPIDWQRLPSPWRLHIIIKWLQHRAPYTHIRTRGHTLYMLHISILTAPTLDCMQSYWHSVAMSIWRIVTETMKWVKISTNKLYSVLKGWEDSIGPPAQCVKGKHNGKRETSVQIHTTEERRRWPVDHGRRVHGPGREVASHMQSHGRTTWDHMCETWRRRILGHVWRIQGGFVSAPLSQRINTTR